MNKAQVAGRLASVAMFLALMSPGVILAQTTGLKIAVVDIKELLDESPQAKSAQKKLEDEFLPRQRELLAKQNELKDRETKLQKDGAVMGADERRNAEEKLRNDAREFERRQNAFVEDLNLRKNDTLGKLQVDLVKQVQAYAKQHGYDLVVSGGVLYAGQTLDITRQVLDSVKAGAEAAPAKSEPAKPAPKK
jgi:outer membrane protein